MAAQPPTNKTLAGLTNPVANSAVAQGLQAARAVNLQQAVAKAPPLSNTTQVAQQVGAEQAKQAGAIQTATAAKTMQDQEVLAKQALANQAEAAQQKAKERALANRKKSQSLATKLAQIDRNLKNKLVDQSIQFEKDEMGRTLWNDRQLMDFKIMNAKSDQELAKFEQDYRQLADRRTQMLKTAYAKIQQALEQTQSRTQQQLSQQQAARLQKAKQDLQQKIAKDSAKKKNRAGMITAAATIAGAVAGTIVTPGVGTAAGASIGQGVGAAVASQV